MAAGGVARRLPATLLGTPNYLLGRHCRRGKIDRRQARHLRECRQRTTSGTRSMDHIRWDTHRDACCRSIARHATLKILLKTKDDPFLLERWILHHRKIVGPNNLVIFDNMSTHPDVARIYDKYRDTVQIIQYPAFYDSLHDVSACRALYDTLRDATRFFIFLDTDEFLVLIDDDRYYDDETIVDYLEDQDEPD